MEISFVPADECHLQMVYEWVNDPLVRKQSFKSEPIPFQDHQQWFRREISDPGSCYLIFYAGKNNPIGQVRISRKGEGEAVIGVLINAENRGKGYSSVIIKMASDYFIQRFPSVAIEAYIKEENLPSYKAFTEAGYVWLKKADWQGFTTNILIYGNHNREL